MKKNKPVIYLTVIAVILAAGVITLGVLLGESNKKHKTSTTLLEAHYRQAYFTLLDETNDMEIKLNKTIVSSSARTQSELLRSVASSAEVSANALSALSSADISVENTMKFINQTGDFSGFLVESLEAGTSLSEQHLESLEKIRDMMTKLGTDLGEAKERINAGNLFISDNNTFLTSVFASLNDASVEYPQLIYDGPFSDALNDRETKGLSGEDISTERGVEIITEIYADVGVSNVTFEGEGGADIPSYNYTASINGQYTFVQLSKQGGSVLSINSFREVTDPQLSENECAELGRQFLVKLGYTDMTAVWICNDNSTVYVNYAPAIDGVIIYPDLIKVKIASDDGSILGMEARNYAFNHTTRTLPAPAISAAQAKSKLTSTDTATGGKLCLIPYKTNAEKLAYEFIVETAGTYYIYVDALTGEEINILYVISTDDGDKLM